MRRSLRGMRMALNMPVAAFDGISLWLVPGEVDEEDALAVVLKHRDPTLTFRLFVASRADEALAEWRAWSEVLGVPLLLAERRGSSTAARATRPTSDRASASPPATERAQGATAFNRSQACNRKNHERDTNLSRRTRDYRAKLKFIRPERRSSLFAPLEFHRAGFHDQLDLIGINFAQNI